MLSIHSVNIMHWDIKPENLILKAKDSLEVKLVEFGLAEFTDLSERLFNRCGTPGYVAPEILLNKEYNH